MPDSELHAKYAPVMRFARGERFFPMAVDAYMAYSALYVKDQAAPLVPRGRVTLDDLTRRYPSRDAFLRSVATGPLHGLEVAAEWGSEAIGLLYQWVQNPAAVWTEKTARAAYDWFSERTRAATRLFWWNSLLLPKASADKQSGLRAELPRFELPQSVRDAAIEAYEASPARQNYTYYYRMAQQAGYLDLQYWFFYAYNDWAGGYSGFNDHEGDWEGFHVFFKLDAGGRPVEPPAYVCYLGHNSRLTKPWNHVDVEKIGGTHPVIYAAAGSHASYPRAQQYPLMALYNLIDYATGDAFTLDHAAWRNRFNLEQAGWVSAFQGSWGTRYWLPVDWLCKTLGLPALSPGEVNLPGVSAPRGPQFNDEGGERQTWQNPATFAGIA